MLNSHTDLQFIIDEYSSAAYIVEYVNKSNRGVSNLHFQLVQVQAVRVFINMLISVETSCQVISTNYLSKPAPACNS